MVDRLGIPGAVDFCLLFSFFTTYIFIIIFKLFFYSHFFLFDSIQIFKTPYTGSQNRQSIKFHNHENINFVEKLYFFILYNQVYIAKHVVKYQHSGFIFRENTSHYKVGG